jgi:hypothetical protein
MPKVPPRSSKAVFRDARQARHRFKGGPADAARNAGEKRHLLTG